MPPKRRPARRSSATPGSANDLTASDIIQRDKTFAQWARAKSFDGFGPFGPAIAMVLDVSGLSVRTEVTALSGKTIRSTT